MNAAAGTSALVRLGARRDRIVLPAWCYVTIALAVGTDYSFRGLYPTPASRLLFGSSLAANPTLRALVGPLYDASTVGGLTAWRIGSLGGVVLALMNIITVVRHTRQEEEAGRWELVGAGAVGRHAPLTAALALVLSADALLGLVIGGGLALLGEPAGDSFALGMALAAVGAVFAGIAAVTAQLAETARAATGLASLVLGVVFVLRAIGDAGTTLSWLAWVSPIGWGERVRAFADVRGWVFVLPVAATALLCAVAFRLAARRDLGAGLLAARPGPAVADGGLRGPLALAWRLNRGVFLGWLAAFVIVGGTIGVITPDMVGIVTGNAQLAKIIGQLGGVAGLSDAFLSAMLGLFGLVSAVFMVQVVQRLRAEETAQRAEPVLATRVGRVPFAAAHLVVSGIGGALLMAGCGVLAGLGYGLRTGGIGTQLLAVLAGALVQVPAAWVVAAVAVALFGLVPAATQAGWAVLVLCVLLGQLGPTLRLPQWVMDVSPFTHAPKLPGGTVSGVPIGWLLVVTALLATVGLIGFRRRDIG